MRNSTAPIAVLGGTFDPVHFGHLRPALEVSEALGFERVHFIPSRVPVHRGDPVADIEKRVGWLQSAINGVPNFVVDLREVERNSPSWMVLTLESLAEEFPGRPLSLIMGMDAFLQIEGWHRWQELFNYAHLVVTHRPGFQRPGDDEIGYLLQGRKSNRVEDLHRTPAETGGGRIFFHPVTTLEISSTMVRKAVEKGMDPRFLLPGSIRKDVIECYQINYRERNQDVN